jgi:hypothetical protein
MNQAPLAENFQVFSLCTNVSPLASTHWKLSPSSIGVRIGEDQRLSAGLFSKLGSGQNRPLDTPPPPGATGNWLRVDRPHRATHHAGLPDGPASSESVFRSETVHGSPVGARMARPVRVPEELGQHGPWTPRRRAATGWPARRPGHGESYWHSVAISALAVGVRYRTFPLRNIARENEMCRRQWPRTSRLWRAHPRPKAEPDLQLACPLGPTQSDKTLQGRLANRHLAAMHADLCKALANTGHSVLTPERLPDANRRATRADILSRFTTWVALIRGP